MRNDLHASQSGRPARARQRYLAPPLTVPSIYLGYIPKGYPGTARTVELSQT